MTGLAVYGSHKQRLEALVVVCLDAYKYDEVRVEAVVAAAEVARGGGTARQILEAAATVRRSWGP